jgi:hypothetical protein
MPSTDSGADCDRAPDEDLTDSENENEIENETGSLAMVDLTEENHFQVINLNELTYSFNGVLT